MLVKLILFVLPFLRLVSALSNVTAVFGDSRIMYGPSILLSKTTDLIVARRECGLRQTRVVDIIPQRKKAWCLSSSMVCLRHD